MEDRIADGLSRALHLLAPAAFAGSLWGGGFRVAVESKAIWRTVRHALLGSFVAAIVFSANSDEPYRIFTTAFLFVAVGLMVGIASGHQARRKASPLRQLLAIPTE